LTVFSLSLWERVRVKAYAEDRAEVIDFVSPHPQFFSRGRRA